MNSDLNDKCPVLRYSIRGSGSWFNLRPNPHIISFRTKIIQGVLPRDFHSLLNDASVREHDASFGGVPCEPGAGRAKVGYGDGPVADLRPPVGDRQEGGSSGSLCREHGSCHPFGHRLLCLGPLVLLLSGYIPFIPCFLEES